MNSLKTPFATLTLERLPHVPKDSLRAWDAADEFILDYLWGLINNDDHKEHPKKNWLSEEPRLLIINDHFSALSLSLNQYAPVHWSDSFIAHQSLRHNAELNNFSAQAKTLASTEDLSGYYDVVLIKVPKTLALLEDQLIRLRPYINEHSLVIGGAMVKHLHRSHLEVFETYLGPTHTSLAKKKARLIFSGKTEKSLTPSPYPDEYQSTEFNLRLCQHANVFARNKIDMGARVILQHFDQLPSSKGILDLGCGNGILGIMAGRQFPDAKLVFVDESYMALASARENVTRNHPNGDAVFIPSNCLDQWQSHPNHEKLDLILCNPPFHQQHSLGDHIAWRMFKQSHQALKKGGQLWVVGNRHLGYHHKLKRLFGHVQTLSQDPKFVVLVATRT